MYKKIIPALLAAIMLSACANTAENSAPSEDTETTTTTTAATLATAPVQEVGFEGMEAIGGEELIDGEYEITVDSSSSMFKIESCTLSVSGDELTAKMTMSGTGYRYLYLGTADNAANADESEYIPFEESEGSHSFTVPVSALDEEIDCAAFSDKKEAWYDRVLVFRADSLPDSAFAKPRYTTVKDLGLFDGQYTIEVTLEGGSGKASIQSPAELTVVADQAEARIIWSSSNYDYMIVNGEKYLPVSLENGSEFVIPVAGFDYKMPVKADTTAMSTPYEIDYTLYFDAGTIN